MQMQVQETLLTGDEFMRPQEFRQRHELVNGHLVSR